MKKYVLLDVILNFFGFIYIVVPNFIAYSGTSGKFPPLSLTWFFPFYLLIVNILCDQKYSCRLPIWRVFHCVFITILGQSISYLRIEYFFSVQDYPVDIMTQVLKHYEVIWDLMVIIFGLFVYQLIIFIGNKAKTVKGNTGDGFLR